MQGNGITVLSAWIESCLGSEMLALGIPIICRGWVIAVVRIMEISRLDG